MQECISFILFISAFFLLPGIYWLKKLKLPIENLFGLGSSLMVGLVLFLFFTLIIRMIGLPFYVLYIYGITHIYLGIRSIRKSKINLDKKTSFYFLIVLFIIFITSYFLAGSLPKAYIDQTGLHLPAARDSFWRLAIVGELISHFPPQHPGFSGELLKNYHFLYDLLVAATSSLIKVDSFLLYTRFYTYFSSFLMVSSIYIFLKTFLKNTAVILFGTVLTVFTGNVSYILPWISQQYDFVARANVFMSDQPFDQSHNPFNLLAYALFIYGLVLFHHSQKQPKTIVLLSFLMAVLLGVKVYAGIILFLAVGTVWMWQIIKERKISFFQILPIVIVLPIVSILRGKSFGILTYNPGWVLTKLIQDRDRLNLPDMVLKEEHYFYAGNYLRVVQYKLMQIGMYLFGNLNIRVLGCLAFSKKIFVSVSNYYFVFLGSAIIYALGIPLLFSQTRGVYDSIQFTPYGLLILSLLTAVVLDHAWTRYIGRRVSVYATIVIGIIIFILGSSTNIFTQIHWRVGYEDISREEVDALTFIRLQTNPDAIILTDVSRKKMTLMYVPGIAERRTFLTGVSLAQQTGVKTDTREEDVRSFFAEPEHNLNFLSKNHISYIYLSDEGLLVREKMYSLGFTEIFTNASTSIFKVI